jgi:hypothetical protein
MESYSVLPNLIIIGAQKCGTTALHHYLQLHPEVFMSEIKELEFFIENSFKSTWYKGIDWYKSRFPQSDAKIYGESSPSYTAYPILKNVPTHMHSIIPDAKLIYMVRDPIQRVISSYIQQTSMGSYRKPFSQLVNYPRQNEFMLICSKYYMQLSQYLPYYPRERILIINQEDLHVNRRETLRQVFNFLEVDPDFNSPDFETRHNESLAKTRARTRIGHRLHRIYLKVAIRLDVDKEYRHRVSRWINSFFSKPFEMPVLTEDLHRKLVGYFQEDVDCFREFTGLAFSEWSL